MEGYAGYQFKTLSKTKRDLKTWLARWKGLRNHLRMPWHIVKQTVYKWRKFSSAVGVLQRWLIEEEDSHCGPKKSIAVRLKWAKSHLDSLLTLMWKLIPEFPFFRRLKTVCQPAETGPKSSKLTNKNMPPWVTQSWPQPEYCRTESFLFTGLEKVSHTFPTHTMHICLCWLSVADELIEDYMVNRRSKCNYWNNMHAHF